MTLTQAEVHRWFQIAKRDRWYREQCPVTAGLCAALAGVMQVSPLTARRMVRGVRNEQRSDGREGWRAGISNKLLPRAVQVIEAVDAGHLIFWQRSRTDFGAAWVEPPGTLVLPQRSLSPAQVWNWWRPCSTCGGRKYLPVTMQGGPSEQDQAWCACYRCHPPGQWPAFGAKGRSEFLADRLLGAYSSTTDVSENNGLSNHTSNHSV